MLPAEAVGHHDVHDMGASNAATDGIRSGWAWAAARAMTPPRLWPTTTAGASPTTASRSAT